MNADSLFKVCNKTFHIDFILATEESRDEIKSKDCFPTNCGRIVLSEIKMKIAEKCCQVPPTLEEQVIIHNIFINTVDHRGFSFKVPHTHQENKNDRPGDDCTLRSV